MENVNLAKVYKEYYSAKASPKVFSAGAGLFLTITGKGDPDEDDFSNRVEALYSVAYGVRARYKTEGKLFTVARLEGFWWADNDEKTGDEFLELSRSEWNSKLMIRMPDFVDFSKLEDVKKQAAEKKTEKALTVQGEIIDQGTVAHILHVGPFADETPTLHLLDAFLQKENFQKTGRHHEIYLSDFRKVDPQKMKTILMYQIDT